MSVMEKYLEAVSFIKKVAVVLIALTCFTALFSEEPIAPPQNLYRRCLIYREQNSPEFTEVQNEARIAENVYKQKLLSSYLSVKAGTGNMTFNFTDDEMQFTMEPNAQIALPSFSNLAFGLSFPFAKAKDAASSGVNFSVGVDLYSQAIATQKLMRKTALETKNTAIEKLNYSKQIIEAEFLSDCKKNMDAYIEYVGKQLAKVSADIEFRKVEIEGYPKNSTRYKAAQLKSLATERQAQTNEKIFFKNAKKFFTSCGIEKNLTSENFQMQTEMFFTELAESIPEQKTFDTAALTLQTSKQFMQAQQAYENMLEQRRIENSPFTLSANTAFSFSKNEITAPVETTLKKKSMSSGLNFKFPGLTLYSGVTIDLDKKKNPSLNLSVTCNPLDIYYRVLSDQNAKMQTEIDTINFKTETEKCEDLLQSTKSNAEALQLVNEAANYECEIYKQNAADIQKLFADGFTTKLDNAQAHLEYLQALIKFAQAKVYIILFNIQTLQSFMIESNAQGEK